MLLNSTQQHVNDVCGADFRQGWGRLGASPHQQWLRAGLIFIACYWFVTFNYIVFSALTASQMMHDAKAYGEKDTAEDFWDDPLSEQAKWLLDILKIFDFWHLVGSIALFVILMIMRQRVRKQFLIPSCCDGPGAQPITVCSTVEDALAVFCCPVCAVAQVARHVHATNEGCQPFDDPGPADLLPQGFTYPNVQGGGNMTVVTTGATAPPQNYMYGGAAGVVQGNAVQEAEVAAGAPIPRAVLASEEPGAPPAKP